MEKYKKWILYQYNIDEIYVTMYKNLKPGWKCQYFFHCMTELEEPIRFRLQLGLQQILILSHEENAEKETI